MTSSRNTSFSAEALRATPQILKRDCRAPPSAIAKNRYV